MKFLVTGCFGFIGFNFINYIKDKYGNDVSIVGVATGAIAIGIMIAERLNLPYAYVRPEPKGHGLKNQIEGKINKNSNVLVIEDLISMYREILSEATKTL